MPNRTIYIRIDDIERWDSLKNKSTHIHNLLNTKDAYLEMEPKQRTELKKVLKQVPSVVNKEAQFVPKPPDPEKGYPCCQLKRPCKHWVWQESGEGWMNTLTGKVRDE